MACEHNRHVTSAPVKLQKYTVQLRIKRCSLGKPIGQTVAIIDKEVTSVVYGSALAAWSTPGKCSEWDEESRSSSHGVESKAERWADSYL